MFTKFVIVPVTCVSIIILIYLSAFQEEIMEIDQYIELFVLDCYHYGDFSGDFNFYEILPW